MLYLTGGVTISRELNKISSVAIKDKLIYLADKRRSNTKQVKQKAFLPNVKQFIAANYRLILLAFLFAVIGHGYFIYKDIMYDHIMVGTGDQTYQMVLFKDYLYEQFSNGNFFYNFTFNGGGNFFTNLSYYYSTSLFFYITAFVTYLLEGVGILNDVGVAYWANSIIFVSIFRSTLILFVTTHLIEYFKVERPFALFSAAFYALSPIYFRHVILWEMFADAMLWLPILVLGAEKIMNKESGVLFAGGVFLSLFNNAYFAYINFLLVFIYIVLRMLVKFHENEENNLKLLGKFTLYGILGFFVALPGFMPFLLGFLKTSRLSPEFNIPLSNFQLTHLAHLLYHDNVLVLPMIFVILSLTFYLYKNSKFRFFTLLSLGLVLLRFNPLVGSIMNGFSYPQYRWPYVIDLFMAITIAIGVKYIVGHSENSKLRKSLLVSSGLTLCLYLLVKHGISEHSEYMIYDVLPILLILQMGLLVFYVFNSKFNRYLLMSFSLVLAVFALFVNNRQLYYDYGLRNDDYFVDKFDADNAFSQAVDYIKKDGEGFHRIDYYSGSNLSMPFNVSTFNLYSSFQNSNQQYFERYFQILSDRDSNGEVSGLGGRSNLNALFKVDYIIAPPDQTFRVPVGYQLVKNFDNLNVYKNTQPLAFIHPVSNLYSTDDARTSTFKDELILDGAFVSEIDRNQTIKDDTALVEQISYVPQIEGAEYVDDTIVSAGEEPVLITLNMTEGLAAYDSIVIEYTLKPIDDSGTYIYYIDDHRIELNGAGLPYSEQRFRNRIQLDTDSEVMIELEPHTDYEFEIHQIHGTTLEPLEKRVQLDQYLDYNYDITPDNLKITFDNKDNYPFMVLPIFDELGWELQVNGTSTDIVNANNGMIGFEIPSGELEIELAFKQPFLIESLIIAVIGLISLGIIDKKRVDMI